MSQHVEQLMRAKLDGWFFAVNPFSGEIKPRRVSRNYVPSYDAELTQVRRATGKMNGKFKSFTSEIDDAIVAGRAKGMTWDQIGATVKRSAGNIRPRYIDLCRMRGIEPIIEVKSVRAR